MQWCVLLLLVLVRMCVKSQAVQLLHAQSASFAVVSPPGPQARPYPTPPSQPKGAGVGRGGAVKGADQFPLA
jgi:hypothetical protein